MSELLDPKKNVAVLGKLAVVAVAFLGTIYVIYHLSSQEGKDALNILGIGKQVISWEDRADSISRNLINQNRQQIASTILTLTHPTGTSPSLQAVRVSKLNGRLLVELTIHWNGGFLGTDYRTQVAWELSEKQHENAKVTFDSAPTAVSPYNADRLNDYFRTKIYPVFVKDMGT